MKDQFSLLSKVALLTGGAGFLAKFHIQALIEKKATIILIDKNYVGLIKQKNLFNNYKNLHIYKCNITKQNSVSKINKILIKKFKKIDILINNAANDFKIDKKNKNKQKDSIGIESWQHDLDVNLTGTLNCIVEFSKQMQKNKYGIILNIASDLSVISPNQNLYTHHKTKKPVSYSVTKHGLIGMTKYFATLFASKGIRINALSPGAIEFRQDSIFKRKINKLIPLGRMAKPDEIKGAVQFLCSDASNYMTGQNIIVDGGRSVW